jgi:hypothetical protein
MPHGNAADHKINSMSKIVSNIQTTLDGGEIGPLVVTWDMESFYDEPHGVHPDNPLNQDIEYRVVDNIRAVELQAFDKIGIDLTVRYKLDKKLRVMLEDKLIAAVEEESTESLQNKTAA